MRQRASLDDSIAGREAVVALRHVSEADVEAVHEALAHVQDDSRSSSSSSPPPVDNEEESDFFLGANDSQSSLGVTNFQDMQVGDGECLPPINRLPNEILIAIIVKLTTSSDMFHVMLTCKRWARNAVDILWHRPGCSNWEKHAAICQTLAAEQPYFCYRDFVKRLNLASLHDGVNDGSVMPLAVCTRIERLTLTGCRELTDTGLTALVNNSSHLLALDVSSDKCITEVSINALADNCPRLQGLNVSGCTRISNESFMKLAKSCRFIKRLKLNECRQLRDEAVLAFAEHCPNMLEIDLQQCVGIGNEPVTSLLARGQALRELRLANLERIDDSAFLSLPPKRVYEHLRILDLTSCAILTDRAVEKIIDVAPRLRNLVLAKCRNITDAAVFAISRLGKNLHYVHLGHCSQITDDSVERLVQACNRIRYIDLGCCSHLTDKSIKKLAHLPKLKRIGLVKCSLITDESVEQLARQNAQRIRPRRDVDKASNTITWSRSSSSLERVHLSYCTNLTVKAILMLLKACPRLTHLSLTGVQAFFRDDLDQFCRDAPADFTEHQRQVFCVFSGQGVVQLRDHLENENRMMLERLEHARGNPMAAAQANSIIRAIQAPTTTTTNTTNTTTNGAFDDVEADDVDDDGLDGTEMLIDTNIDTQPLLGQIDHGLGQLLDHGIVSSPTTADGNPGAPTASPPPQTPGSENPFGYVGGHPAYVPQQAPYNDLPFPSSFVAQAPLSSAPAMESESVEAMDLSSTGLSGASMTASAGLVEGQSRPLPTSFEQGPSSLTGRVLSLTERLSAAMGGGEASSSQIPAPAHPLEPTPFVSSADENPVGDAHGRSGDDATPGSQGINQDSSDGA